MEGFFGQSLGEHKTLETDYGTAGKLGISSATCQEERP